MYSCQFLASSGATSYAEVHYGFEYTGPSDPSQLVPDVELPEEVILERLGRILGGVSVMPARVK